MFVYKYSHYTSSRVSAISHRHMEVPIVLSQSKSLSRAPLADFGVNFILFSIIPLKQKISNSQSIRNSLESAGCTNNSRKLDKRGWMTCHAMDEVKNVKSPVSNSKYFLFSPTIFSHWIQLQVKFGTTMIQGHPPELSDSVKLLLFDAKRHGFEIDQVLKSIDWHFLYQNFSHFGQVVCLLYEFEVAWVFSHWTDFPSKIKKSVLFALIFIFLKFLCHRDKIDLQW